MSLSGIAGQPLINPSGLFEFRFSIRRFDLKLIDKDAVGSRPNTNGKRSKKTSAVGQEKSSAVAEGSLLASLAWSLGDEYRLPEVHVLSNGRCHSDVWMTWHPSGLAFQMEIRGKSRPPRFVQPEGGFSDGLRVWIDTRSSPNIHRATRFCHVFHFFPGELNGNQDLKGASGILDQIPRAKENPKEIDVNQIRVGANWNGDGYRLVAFVPADCLTGYLPEEFSQISLFCDVVDAELRTQSLTLGPEFRYAEDPSHWVICDLI